MRWSFRWKERAASSPRRSAARSRCMASRKCRHGALRTSESTTRRCSGSSASIRPKSTVCARAAPFQRRKSAQHRRRTMDEIVTERAGSILRVQLNRPSKKNAMTSSMYVTLAGIFNDAAQDERTRVVLWHGAGDSFCAGNDVEDFLRSPPGPGESPQARLMNALMDFDKPVVAAVHGAAIGGGTTMLLHCDFVYAGESAKFQMPFINLAVVPEFGSSCSVPARVGHLRAAEWILLGLPFGA